MANGNFHRNECVLDAAGGDAPLQAMLALSAGCVFNVDVDHPAARDRALATWGRDGMLRNVIYRSHDLTALPFPDGFFDKVVCASVLEHVDLHLSARRELWRVLAPGGRLLLTFDVADRARWNHTIDLRGAAGVVGLFGLTVPEPSPDDLSCELPEIDPVEGEPATVKLKVLCLWADKE